MSLPTDTQSASLCPRCAASGIWGEEHADGMYPTPASGTDALHRDFLYWTGRITEASLQLCLGVLGANWAAFGSIDKLRGNLAAELSIATVLIALTVNLLGAGALAWELRSAVNEAEADHLRWRESWAKGKGNRDPWPYNHRYNDRADFLRVLRVLLPLVAVGFFAIALGAR